MAIYDWEKIFKSYSDKELEEFFVQKRVDDSEARFCVINEMISRNKDFANIEKYKEELQNDCKVFLETESKRTLREFIIWINPFILLAMALFFFLNLLLHLDNFSINSLYSIGTIFFGGGALIDFLISKQVLRSISKKKEKRHARLKFIIESLSK